MTKAELVDDLAKHLTVSKADLEKILIELVESVMRALKGRDKAVYAHPGFGFHGWLSNSPASSKSPPYLSAVTGLDLKQQLYQKRRSAHETEETPEASVQNTSQEDLVGLPAEVFGKEPGHSSAARCCISAARCCISRRRPFLRDLLPFFVSREKTGTPTSV
jgi:hypothetical protein